MKTLCSLSFLWLATAMAASATPCGTVASPTSCTATTGPIQFSFSNFQFVTNSNSGLGNLYTGGDINIDVFASSANGGLTFTKNPSGPISGTEFVANTGEHPSFTFSYDVTLTPLQPGTVAFDPQFTNRITQDTRTGNGFSVLQLIVSPTNCLVNSIVPTNSCSLVGVSGTTLSAANIVSIAGGSSGSASVGVFGNVFNATFTADTGAQQTPEPSTFGLLGAGLLALKFARRR